MDFVKRFFENGKNRILNHTGFENMHGTTIKKTPEAVKIIVHNKFENNKDVDLIKIINKISNSDYVIFLTPKYFTFYNKLLLKYFKKYNIVYFKYSEKQKILDSIELINYFIQNTKEMDKNEIIKELNKSTKFKIMYFLENTIEPNVLYKKISFSNEELYMSFDNYIVKKMEYKLRTFCQIAEKLGAERIKIQYDSKILEKSSLNLEVSGPRNGSGISTTQSNETNNTVNMDFEYTNYYYNINLNKFYINELIEEESEFYISKEEYKTDIDLKFLINSRCINLIQKYDTNIMIHKINEIERKIFLKARNYGLNFGCSNSLNDYVNIKISIDFIDIYKNPDCIDGNNLYVLKEGFWHLSNVIKEIIKNNESNNKESEDNYVSWFWKKEENKQTDNKIVYRKIKKFLESHIICLYKGEFEDKEYQDNKLFENNKLVNIYYDIIKLNFDTDSDDLFYETFRDNLTYQNFKLFRNIILKGSKYTFEVNKLHLVCLQYHLLNTKLENVLNDVKRYINISFNRIIKTLKSENPKLNLLRRSTTYDFDEEEINDLSKTYFIEIITNCLSYILKTSVEDDDEIMEMIKDLLNTKFSSNINYIKTIERNIDAEQIIIKIMDYVLMDLRTIYKKSKYIKHINDKYDIYDSLLPFDSICHLIISFLEKDIINTNTHSDLNFDDIKTLICDTFDDIHFINNYDNYKILITWNDYLEIKKNIKCEDVKFEDY